jgi:excisionase family DNA binding protein
MNKHPTPNAEAVRFVRLAHSPKSACALLGCGMTHLYELIGAGKIEARKSGRKTIILDEALRGYLASLPLADIRTGQRAGGGLS